MSMAFESAKLRPNHWRLQPGGARLDSAQQAVAAPATKDSGGDWPGRNGSSGLCLRRWFAASGLLALDSHWLWG